jgi:hypothetical protein
LDNDTPDEDIQCRPAASGGLQDAKPVLELPLLESRTTMEFTALFLAVTVVMLAAWLGARTLALALFAVTLVACVATYLHHASDVLKLSF